MGEAIDPDRTVVVLVAHGSRAEAANDAHRAMAEQVAAVGALAVRPAFLELAEPSIPDAIEAAIAEGARRVLVLPYFLYPGRHLVEDIPALVDRAAAAHPEVEVRVLEAFGADPAVPGLLGAQARAALDEGA